MGNTETTTEVLYPLQTSQEADTSFRFTKEDGTVIKVASAVFNTDGEITSITDVNGVTYTSTQFNYERELLLIRGYGYIPQGTYVKYQKKNYILLFGWHTNSSNQTIYSWYLQSVPSDFNFAAERLLKVEYRTLYKWMVDEIELVSFK